MRELNPSEIMHVAGAGDVPDACSTDTLLKDAASGAVSGALAGAATGGLIGAVAGAIFGAAIGGATAAYGCANAVRESGDGGCS